LQIRFSQILNFKSVDSISEVSKYFTHVNSEGHSNPHLGIGSSDTLPEPAFQKIVVANVRYAGKFQSCGYKAPASKMTMASPNRAMQ